MKRTLISETIKKTGQKVRLCGWVYSRRDHGQLVFVDLKDRSGIIQVVGHEKLGNLRISDAIEVTGKVKSRPKNLVNPKIETGKIELAVEELKVLSKSEELPFDIGPSKLSLKLPKLLDHRPLSLKHPSQQVIFKVQAEIARAFREFLKAKGFTEIFCPTITATATEGGSEIFEVEYYDYDAFLAQSPQLYKQIMVGVFERVFTVAHAYRAEPSVTTRHLAEYIGLDVEMGFIDSWQEVIDTADELIKHIINTVFERCQQDLDFRDNFKKITNKKWQTLKPKLAKKTPQLKLREVQKILGVSQKEPDLSPQDEREICRWASKEKGSDMVIVTHYPIEKRPFYTYPDPEDPEYTLGFDFLGRGNVEGWENEGFEWVTGGQRINDYQQLMSNIKKWGYDPKGFEIYLQAFKYGMPPEGGFCLGLERLTQSFLGLANIRQASLFPRDMERADVRLSTIQARKHQKTLSKNLFEEIVNLLENEGVDYQLFEHQPVYTSEQAAKVRGTQVKQGAKALVMFADKKPMMLVLSAAKKVDSQKFKKAFEIKDLRMATEEEVEKITGVKIGAVPPFGNLLGLKTFVDKSLGENKEIAFNAGLHTKSIKMKHQDWLRLVKPRLGQFS